MSSDNKRPIKIMLSNRHAHITKETSGILFGENGLTFGGAPVTESSVGKADGGISIIGPKGSIDNVRILLRYRKDNQVEILQSDCFRLGISAPTRMSGCLEGAATIKLKGPCGEVESPCAIVAARHIHLLPEDAEKYGVKEGQVVKVRCGTNRSLVFENVVIELNTRVKHVGSVMHIDFEEGNAAGVKNGDYGEIIP